MPFGLTIGTERAAALQQSIQDELTRRGFSPDADPVMAEYITIMVINNKTAAQITSELEDLIGSDYESSFTDWLFAEAAKGATGPDAPPPQVPAEPPASDPGPSQETQVHATNESKRPGQVPRNNIYQHAMSQALPTGPGSAQKRTASIRSPSPSHPNKSRRTELPTGPRAMLRDGSSNPNANPHPNTRSLLDRVGGPAPGRNGNANGFQRDEIQARIDNIVNNSPDPTMMIPGGFPGMGMGGGMDINAMAAANIGNPLMLQEMMVNQMALMAQMASSMGILNTGTGQFSPPGFGMQGVMPGNMSMFQEGMNNNSFQQQGPVNGSQRGRGGARGGRGMGRGRGGAVNPTKITDSPAPESNISIPTPAAAVSQPSVIAVPIPTTPLPSAASAATLVAGTTAQRPGYVVPERPQSPTLCKFGLKCTNAHCRYSHPSPVATAESGVVLSNEACEQGKGCKDKDCIKAHVSPAVLNPQAVAAEQPVPSPVIVPHHSPTLCRFGANCTRPGCNFAHPARTPHTNSHFSQPCRFGAGCTRASCVFQHPEGRVLPSTFHRGLSTSSPMVHISSPETGTMGASPHKSVTFNNPNVGAGVKERLEKQVREVEEKKNEAEKAMKEAEAAAASSQANGKKVAITA